MQTRPSACRAAGATLRAVRARDIGAVQRFVAHLSLRSRTQRFFVPLRELPGELAHAIEGGDPRHRFVVAESEGELVAVGQYAIESEPHRCEVALVVADHWQGQGLGARLLERLLADAARAGLREARLEMLADNRAMRTLARRAGFRLALHPEDAQLLLGTRALAPGDAQPTPSGFAAPALAASTPRARTECAAHRVGFPAPTAISTARRLDSRSAHRSETTP